MKQTVREPTCISCPNNLYFGDFVPKKQFGVMMHCGERFCTGSKRARRFKRSDPKIHVPKWCPKRKVPCEVRIYALKNPDEWILHVQLSCLHGKAASPSGFRYALRLESHTDLTPSEFWKRCDHEPYWELLDVGLQQYEVLEIDDGLKPVFFYKTEDGLVPEMLFDAAAARKNRLEIPEGL